MEILQTGKQTCLRHPVPDDAAAFLEMVRQSRRLHRPWIHPPGDAETFGRYVEHAASARFQRYLICLRGSGEIAGVANLSEIVRGVFLSTYLDVSESPQLSERKWLTAQDKTISRIRG